MYLYEQEDFYVCQSHGTGGKAGKNKSKTTSIQVRQRMPGGYILLQSYNYPINDMGKRQNSIEKAISYIKDWLRTN